MTRTLEYLPLKSIADTGENPRQSIDKAELKELTASIGEHGVLQPILVERDGKGYKIVAGHRRVAAAIEAGLKEIPAQIEGNGANRRAAALTENIIRADLTPLEEAQALAQLQEETGDGVRELARRIGKGKDWVSDRLRLAKLPESVQKRVAAGDVGLHAVPVIARICDKVSPEVGEAVVQKVATDSYMRSYLDRGDKIGFLVSAAVEGRASSGLLKLGWNGVAPAKLPIDAAAKKEIVAAVKELGPKPSTYGSTPRVFKFDDNLAGAAKKAGCLLDLDGYKFVTDPAWIEKQARNQLAKWLKEPKAAKPSKADLDAENAAKSQAAAAEETRRAELFKANLELGTKLREKFAAVEVTTDLARLFVSFVADSEYAYQEGLVHVDDRLQRAGDDGKVEYAEYEEISKLVEAELAEAKTPEEVFAVGIRILLTATYAQDPRRQHLYRDYYGLPEAAKAGLDQLAKKERVVPKALKKDASK